MKKKFFILFVIILYSQGILNILGIHKLISDGLLIIIPSTILLFSKHKIRLPPGLYIVIIYILWSIFAAIYHDEGIIRALLFSRYLAIGYIVFAAAYNTYFSEKQILNINNSIFIMFFIQIFASIVEILFIGRTEQIVGIMFSEGGGPATTFPLFAFPFFFSFFLYKRKFIYLALSLSFLIIGYASEKLGIYILLPIIATLAIILFKKIEKTPILSKSILKSFLSIFAIILVAAIIIPSASLRTERLNIKNYSLIDRIDNFLDYAKYGELNTIRNGYTGSRSATSLRVIDETFSRPIETFLFGRGFISYDSIGHTFGQGAYEEYGIVYGITGWTYDSLIYGWPIMFLHVGFYILIYFKLYALKKTYKIKNYWNTLLFSLLVNFYTFLLIYFFYNQNFTIGGWVIYIYMFFSGILLAPQYRKLTTYDAI